MAITAIVGRPGHGKSYSATEIAIIPALQEGRYIFTNIPLRDEAITRDFPTARVHYVELSAEQVSDPDFWQFAPGALVILDELWKVWPSGLRANRIPPYQLAFIKEHRHRTDDDGRWQDIVLVTQNLSDIASAIREMVETTVICMQLQDMGAAGWFVREYYTGAIKGCESGPSEKLVNNERVKYEQTVYQYYVSNTQGTKTNIGPQGAKVVKQTVWGGWKAKAAGFILLAVLVALPFSLWKTKQGMDKIKEQSKASTHLEPANPEPIHTQPAVNHHPFSPPVPVQPEPPPPPPQPEPSKEWRLSGRYRAAGPAMVMITDGTHTRRIPQAKYCRDEDGDIVCTIAGQVIASWTGNKPTDRQPFEPFATINTEPQKPP